MKKKAIIHQFDPVIYPFKLWICISEDLTASTDRFFDAKTESDFVFENTKRYAAMTLPVIEKKENFYGVLVLYKKKKYCTVKNIAHEASHAAKSFFEHIGADISAHEPFEYLIGWIAECIEKVLKNKV